MDAFLPTSAACPDTERLIQAVLDREHPVSALQNEHGRACPACRHRVWEATQLLTALDQLAATRDVSLPVNFADRVIPVILADQRTERRSQQRRQRILAACALAASVTLAVVFFWDRFTTTAPGSPPREITSLATPTRSETPPILVSAQLHAMRDTLADLTRRTAAETLAPAQTLLPDASPEPVTPPTPRTPTTDSVATLADVPEAAISGLEPLTGSAERAWNLFLRDVGFSQAPKPKF
ncbi:MAG: hypothetical protein LC104_13090 [Bacteroidales bacterium]|nr:hypothetical protein [Bacteroidales bacterium]